MLKMFHSSRSLYIKKQHFAVIRCLVLLLSLTQIQQSTTLIVPDELPSILSLVYANIPPIKKGTDSRLGFGFRLGEHADFQVLYELGPQKETRRVEKYDSDGSSFNKRQVKQTQQLRVQQDATSIEHSASATWLEKLSSPLYSMKNKTLKKQTISETVGLPVMTGLPDKTLSQLHMLYKMATTSTTQ